MKLRSRTFQNNFQGQVERKQTFNRILEKGGQKTTYPLPFKLPTPRLCVADPLKASSAPLPPSRPRPIEKGDNWAQRPSIKGEERQRNGASYLPEVNVLTSGPVALLTRECQHGVFTASFAARFAITLESQKFGVLLPRESQHYPSHDCLNRGFSILGNALLSKARAHEESRNIDQRGGKDTESPNTV